jgi:hypothetical protein
MPVNERDVKRLYKPQKETNLNYVYRFIINLPRWPIEDQAYIFIGADKKGEGYIMNPNRAVATMIRSMVISDEVMQYGKDKDGKYDYDKGITYRIKK